MVLYRRKEQAMQLLNMERMYLCLKARHLGRAYLHGIMGRHIRGCEGRVRGAGSSSQTTGPGSGVPGGGGAGPGSVMLSRAEMTLAEVQVSYILSFFEIV